MIELKNKKWYCSTHKVYLQICTNHSTGLMFLKCPCNKNLNVELLILVCLILMIMNTIYQTIVQIL